MANGTAKFGPLKMNVTGISAFGVVLLVILAILFSLGLLILAVWVFIHHFMIVSTGEFTWPNVLWLVLSAGWIIHAVTDHTK